MRIICPHNCKRCIHVQEMKRTLEDGGIIVYMTDTLYALGASIYSEEGISKLYALKGRPEVLPFSVSVGSIDALQHVARPTEYEMSVIRKLHPLPMTFVITAREGLHPYLVKDGKVGVRILEGFCPTALGPMTATSANIHGKKSPSCIREIQELFGNHVSYYIDRGVSGDIPSTVYDVQNKKIIRLGIVSEKVLGERING